MTGWTCEHGVPGDDRGCGHWEAIGCRECRATPCTPSCEGWAGGSARAADDAQEPAA